MQPTAYTLGNNIAVTNTYDHNYLTGTTAVAGGTTLHSMGFAWNLGTGNLSARDNAKTNLHEQFAYDAMQRCTTATGAATGNISTTYDNTGNITNKNDVGNYAYTGSQPHAVTEISNPASGFLQQDQNITYNELNKVATITENTNTLAFAYGVAAERRKATLKQSENVLWERYYAAGYDKTVFADAHTRELNYIAGPGGLCAIYVQNITNNENKDTLYYILKDHLGSLATIADKNGSVLQRIDYNMWGKRSIAGGNYTNFLFDRGYTGHEHLDAFGLINMNGRVYDPALGRFLAPDKYVQGTGSQRFNRYSYCLNNPLKYTDPSGGKFHRIFKYTGYSYVTSDGISGGEGHWDSFTYWENDDSGGGGSGAGGSGGSGERGGGGGSGEMSVSRANSEDGKSFQEKFDSWPLEKKMAYIMKHPELAVKNGNLIHYYNQLEKNIFALAYAHFQTGGRNPLNVSTSSLDFGEITQKNLVYNSKANTYDLDLYKVNPMSQTALALGKISLINKGNNQYSIQPDYYDFNIEWDNGFTKRNIATFGAGLLHYGPNPLSPLILGGPYWINFNGTVTIKP